MSVTAGRTGKFNTDGLMKFLREASFGESVLRTPRFAYAKRNSCEGLDVSAASGYRHGPAPGLLLHTLG